MARNIKHVGQLTNTGRRCVVVFREIPNEPDNCLIVDTDALQDWMHDDVINSVESQGAQQSANFYEYAQRAVFTDGSNMLQAMHARKLLVKVPTSLVKMTPNNTDSIMLDELNRLVREQNGDKPAIQPVKDPNLLNVAGKDVTEAVSDYVDPKSTTADATPTDADLAKSFLSQAETFEAEAQNLREQAYEMDPSLKPRRGRPAKQTA
jgi:hypothetical protein